MSEINVQQGDLVIYTDQKKFVEFIGEVAIVRDREATSKGTFITVEWMNEVKFQGQPAGLSKFSTSSFDRLSINTEIWKKYQP